jgi:D-tyrosyl-tRNA(Tyr) deacylase
VQRVSRAAVRVDGETVAEIGPGLLVLLGVARGDEPHDAERLAAKIVKLRVFESGGRFDQSLLDTGGELLAVSQFTLLADVGKGNRPSFTDAASTEEAEPLYDGFCSAVAAFGVRLARGRFGARMEVELVNDGPVTLALS